MGTLIKFGEQNGIVTNDRGEYIRFIDSHGSPYVIHRDNVRTTIMGINPVLFTIGNYYADNVRYEEDQMHLSNLLHMKVN